MTTRETDATVISWQAHHPDRHAEAEARQVKPVKTKGAHKAGRAAKDALMPKAREIAASGVCHGWMHMLEMLEHAGTDTSSLRIWANATDKSEIDRMCARVRSGSTRG